MQLPAFPPFNSYKAIQGSHGRIDETYNVKSWTNVVHMTKAELCTLDSQEAVEVAPLAATTTSLHL